MKVTLDGLLASFSSPPSETLHDDQAMLLRAQEGWVAKHPVVLIPGFVTSGKPVVWMVWGASRQAASLECALRLTSGRPKVLEEARQTSGLRVHIGLYKKSIPDLKLV